MLGISALAELALAQIPFFLGHAVGGMVTGEGEGGPGRRRRRDPWSETLTRKHWKELEEL